MKKNWPCRRPIHRLPRTTPRGVSVRCRQRLITTQLSLLCIAGRIRICKCVLRKRRGISLKMAAKEKWRDDLESYQLFISLRETLQLLVKPMQRQQKGGSFISFSPSFHQSLLFSPFFLTPQMERAPYKVMKVVNVSHANESRESCRHQQQPAKRVKKIFFWFFFQRKNRKTEPGRAEIPHSPPVCPTTDGTFNSSRMASIRSVRLSNFHIFTERNERALPVQVKPSPSQPGQQVQVKLPRVLVHWANTSQGRYLHSFSSATHKDASLNEIRDLVFL